MNPLYQALGQIVTQCAPQSLAASGELACKIGERWQAHSGANLVKLGDKLVDQLQRLAGPPDLALISNTLEHLPHDEGALLLGQLRNYGTHQIAVLVGETPDWAFTDFIGLGFRRHAELSGPEGHFTLYTYNLDSYNHKRAWNNPDHWANPEMWGKAWW